MVKFVFAVAAFIVSLCNFISVGACREVVFVINSGQSMNDFDPFHTAPESVAWGAQNFSENDEVGIITFKNDVTVIRPLSKIKDNPVTEIPLSYYGTSDAGAGLLAAIDMLTPKFNTQRDIIFITSGENLNAQSETNFLAGLKQTNWLGISVYYVNLRHDVDPKYYRLYNDTTKEIPINYLELMTTIRTIIQGDWRTPRITLPINNLTTGTLNFEVPVTSAEGLKISLLSSSAGYATLKNVQPEFSVQGRFIKFFNVKAPSTNNFEIEINYPQGTGLTLDVIPTVSGVLKTDYSFSLSGNILEITPVYAKDTLKKILDNKFFDGKRVNLRVNDTEISGVIMNGTIQAPIDDLDENISIQKVHFEDIGIIFVGDDTSQIFVRKIPYLALILALFGVLTIAGLSYLIYRKRNKSAYIENAREMFEADKKLPAPLEEVLPKFKSNTKFSYGGKLMIYVIKTPEPEDIAPREFNLFRMNSAQIPLLYVLEQCAIDKFFENIKDIFILPEKNCIRLENKSDCTITKRNVLVEKGESVELYYGDSANILSADETAELILQYKSLKPS